MMYELPLYMAIMAILGYYGPYGHDHGLFLHIHDEYPTKEHYKTSTAVKISPAQDIPIKSYTHFMKNL